MGAVRSLVRELRQRAVNRSGDGQNLGEGR